METNIGADNAFAFAWTSRPDEHPSADFCHAVPWYWQVSSLRVATETGRAGETGIPSQEEAPW